MALIRLSGAVLLLILVACGGNATTSTPPSVAPPVSAAVTPVATSASPEVTQVPVPPSLSVVAPEELAPGEEVQIAGSGGLIELRTADGKVRGYIESAKSFTLFFDGEPVGDIDCYVNTCQGAFNVPGDATPGRHEISVEGGSTRSLTVVEAQIATPDATPQRGYLGTEAPVFFGLRISALPSGDMIPVRYTCNGEDVSSGLSWTTIPPGTETFLILVDDPDAPGGTWTHWLVFNIPGDSLGLDENQPQIPQLPSGGVQGSNSWGDVGYGGPCPRKGPAHRYRFFLYAVDTSLDLPSGASREQVSDALAGHIVAEHWITRTYGR